MTLLGTILIAAATGIGGSLLTMPIQAKAANSKALETLEKVYGTIIKTLNNRVDKLESELEKLIPKRCDKKNCANRIPPVE